MRLLEIKIDIFEEKEAVLVGEENAKTEPKIAIIDLDCVTSAWEQGDNYISIQLSNGVGFLTNAYTLKEFKDKWMGTTPEADSNYGVEVDCDCDDEVSKNTHCYNAIDKCPCCGQMDIITNEYQRECLTCGYMYT